MFASIRACTRAHPESTVRRKRQTRKIAIYHRAQRSKFGIRHLKLFLQSCFPRFTHNSSISMNPLIKSICLHLTRDISLWTLTMQTMEIAMNRHQLRLHHHLVRHLRHLRHCRPRYQAFVVIHLNESPESGKASVQPLK